MTTTDSPQQYITKPVVIEAWKINRDNLDVVAKWCNGKVQGHAVIFPKIRHRGTPLVPDSKDNKHYALVGNYVVRVANGFTHVEAEEFEKRHQQRSQRIQA